MEAPEESDSRWFIGVTNKIGGGAGNRVAV